MLYVTADAISRYQIVSWEPLHENERSTMRFSPYKDRCLQTYVKQEARQVLIHTQRKLETVRKYSWCLCRTPQVGTRHEQVHIKPSLDHLSKGRAT